MYFEFEDYMKLRERIKSFIKENKLQELTQNELKENGRGLFKSTRVISLFKSHGKKIEVWTLDAIILDHYGEVAVSNRFGDKIVTSDRKELTRFLAGTGNEKFVYQGKIQRGGVSC